MIIAIDGPAGSGKGTIAKILAEKLNLLNLDTGATYRCVALMTLKKGIKIEEEKKIIDLIDDLEIKFHKVNGEEKVYLNDEDVTSEIRSIPVTKIVSPISSIIGVRLKLVDLQRRIAKGKDVILEGRDIGTYVFPNADVKIYLDAKVEERAMRRYKENIEKGLKVTYEEVLKDMIVRDENDKNKKLGALKKAEDAIVIDSTKKNIEEVADEIEDIIIHTEAWRKKKC